MDRSPHTLEGRSNISKGLLNSDKTIGRPVGTPVSEETRQKMIESSMGNHHVRFGTGIAENIFKGMHPDAEPAKYQDPFDFVLDCEEIDVKASTLSKATRDWRFNIRKNTHCDKFALMAFDDAKHRKLIHLWMIPSHIISHVEGVSVSEGTAGKWQEYEVEL